MSLYDPWPASVPAPTTTALNVGSLTRLAASLLAGYLGKLGFDGNQSAAIAAGVIALAVGIWHIYKNHAVTEKLATAMSAPAVRVVAPPPPPLILKCLAILALVVVFGRGLTACTTPAQVIGTQAQVLTLQGDTSLDLTYNIAAQAYVAALPTMTPATHDKLKPMLVQAYAMVQAVDAGQVLAGSTSLISEITDAATLIAQVRAALQPAS